MSGHLGEPTRFRIPGRSTDTTGWKFPMQSPEYKEGADLRDRIDSVLESHLREGFGVADTHIKAALNAVVDAATSDADFVYLTETNFIQAIRAFQYTLPEEEQASFTQDTQGKGNFPGGYAQPDGGDGTQAGGNNQAGGNADSPSELWKTEDYSGVGPQREWDSYDDALNHALTQNNIPFDPNASRADRLAIARNALGDIEITSGSLGGWIIKGGGALPDSDTAGGVISTDRGMYQQDASGEWSALDMASAPASMEYMGGMLWMRGTDGSLAPVNNLLERMVEQKILEGDWETALQWDDFRNRPSPQEHLQSMLEYARTPADQVLLSAIARGYAEGLVPPQAGSLARVGPIPKEATEAWERYERSITGGPAREEMEEFLASEQAARETEKAEYFQSMTDMRDAFSSAIQDIEKQNKEVMDNFASQLSDGFAQFNTEFTDLRNSINNNQGGNQGGGNQGGNQGGGNQGGNQGGGNQGGNQGGASVNLGTTAGQLASLSAEWGNKYPGMNFPPETAGMSDAELVAWLGNKNNWPDTPADKEALTSKEYLETEPELQNILSDYETASEQVAGLQGQGETPASVFGVQSDLVDWGSEDAESQFVYQQADPDWGLKFDDAGEELPLIEQDWQHQYFAPQVEAEQEAIERGQTEGMAGFEAGLWEGAEGGIVQGPTFALLGEKEPEVVVPFSKIKDFRRGVLPVKNQKVTETGSRVAEFAEGGLVFGPEEIESRGGAANVGAVPGVSTLKDPRYITNETLEGIRSGTLLQNPDDPYDIYSAGGRETETTERLDAAQAAEMAKPATFEESLANVSGGEQGNLPIGVQQVLGGRSPRPLAGRLLRQAGMALPSAQAWRNLSPDERAVYTDLARRSGISEGYLESELQTATPSGGGGARRARMLPLATRRIFR